jgi:hypothetical protein
MNRRGFRALLYAALAALYVLHNDLWLWNDPRLFLGLPVGLVYHIGFCVVVSAVLGLLVFVAGPPLAAKAANAANAATPAIPASGEGERP